MYRSRSLPRFFAVRLALIVLLVGSLAAPTADAATCGEVQASIRALVTHLRAARSPDTSPSRVAGHEQAVEERRRFVTSHVGACDWRRTIGRVPLLAPLLDAARSGSANPAWVAFVHLDVTIKSLLPDDPLCVTATRQGGGARRSNRCFRGQEKGANSANLTRIGKGWCAARKGGGNARYLSMEMNAIGKLFESPGLPAGFNERMLERIIDTWCPETADF